MPCGCGVRAAGDRLSPLSDYSQKIINPMDLGALAISMSEEGN